MSKGILKYRKLCVDRLGVVFRADFFGLTKELGGVTSRGPGDASNVDGSLDVSTLPSNRRPSCAAVMTSPSATAFIALVLVFVAK